MPSVKLYNKKAEEIGKIELSDTVFGKEYNEFLIHSVVVAQLANKRQGTKSALTRTEVRGGGIKPWRQKGTGRARQGSIRAPQWTHGGVVFAPKPRDFSQKINKTAKREALKSVLSKKLAMGEILVVDKIDVAEPKTREVKAVLDAFSLNKNILMVTSGSDAALLRAAANLSELTMIDASLVNVYDIVSHKTCLFTEGAVKKVEEAFAQ